MHAHNAKLDHANVVAVFENQDDAEEAILGLRVAGFRDARVGFFARDATGVVEDFVWQGYTLLGTAIGVVVGLVLGATAGIVAVESGASNIAPAIIPGDFGVMITCALCGALLLGMTGALIGWGTPRGDALHMGSEMRAGRYVVSVDAGQRTGEAWAVLRRHGGHPPHPEDAVAATAVIA